MILCIFNNNRNFNDFVNKNKLDVVLKYKLFILEENYLCVLGINMEELYR